MSQSRQLAARSPDDEPFFAVRSLETGYSTGHEIAVHGHPWHQLIYASRGVMTVWTEHGAWVAPPQWAVFAPAGVQHAIRFSGESRFSTLYLNPDWATDLPHRCAVVAVSPLLRELILEAVRRHMLDRRVMGDAALARLILDGLAFADRAPFDIARPISAAARAVAECLEAGSTTPLPQLARDAGLTLRTLERRFLAETGLSLGRWRRQAAMLRALRSLARESSVKAVAADAGYQSPSAFVAAFKAQFGETPGRYFPYRSAPGR